MSFATADLNGFRFVFSTNNPKELTAHLETLDALQVRRPRHLQTPRCMWVADLTLRRAKGLIATTAAQHGSDLWMDGEDSQLRVYAAPEDIEHEIARLQRTHADYFKKEARITNLRLDNLN